MHIFHLFKLPGKYPNVSLLHMKKNAIFACTDVLLEVLWVYL